MTVIDSGISPRLIRDDARQNAPISSTVGTRPTSRRMDDDSVCKLSTGAGLRRPAFEYWHALNPSGNRMVLLLLVFLVNSLALVFSVYFYIVGPVELRWIFAVWSVTSSMLLYFIAMTYRDIRRRQMINRWILGPGRAS